ncbi:MAG TPA: 16S rRNA (cytosine(1402)-N(4))-methyltransferase RsmH [Bacteroidota bacterium]|nr:16S rRNA (cytosine(1402)-N(4))-methyltransferase RsmH [Bacteroidota bacterium]
MTNVYHTPVLAGEVLEYLQVVQNGIYVDGTLGGGGHAENILQKSAPSGKLVAIDMDKEAIIFAKNRLEKYRDRVIYIHDNFSNLMNITHNLGVERISGLLLDLGISSHQLNEKSRGFSYRTNDRLDMRMNQSQSLDGWTVINKYDQQKLTHCFSHYGEEYHSMRIAKKVVEVRNKNPIDTTSELAKIVELVVGKRFLQKSLSRIFQAIRIEVNNELDNLRQALIDTVDLLERGGRIVVISYHSLEDRITKEFFRCEAKKSLSGESILTQESLQPRLRILTKKPLRAGINEVTLNPRARSAKMRAAEKV